MPQQKYNACSSGLKAFFYSVQIVDTSRHLYVGKTPAIALAIACTALFSPVSQAQSPAGAAAPSAPAAPGAHGSAMMNKPGMAAGEGMDMKGMMSSMTEKMNATPSTGNTDIDFALMMRLHHQEAVNMAQAELKNGKSPEMKKMATKIIADQRKEIAQFDAYLAKNGHSMEPAKK
jgi:hypothetical protein